MGELYGVRQAAQAGFQQYETIMDAIVAAKLNTIAFHKKMAERGLSFPDRDVDK